MNQTELLTDSAEVWCSTFPRRVSASTPAGWRQNTAYSVEEVVDSVTECGEKGDPGFVSVYSFPRGHTSDEGENIPHVDTLYFDVDRDQSTDDGSTEGWARDMSALLVRTRMVAQKLVKTGKDKYWRAALSGHKGVHLYLDFEPIPVENGNEAQFRNGLKEYSAAVVESLSTATNLPRLDDYFDVNSGKDPARLTRLPNTLHEGATERFGEPRYCVPVSIRELATVTPEKYIELTREPRPVPDLCRRVPNEQAHEVVTRMVRNARGSGTHYSGGGGSFDVSGLLDEYEENEANDEVTIQLLNIHLRQKPCIWAFRENPDAFKKGQQSHVMEMNVIAAMKNLGAPVDVMHEFFEEIPGYSRQSTDERIAAVIGAEMATADDDPDEKYRGLNCETIISDAPAFCCGKNDEINCRIWNREFADSKILN